MNIFDEAVKDWTEIQWNKGTMFGNKTIMAADGESYTSIPTQCALGRIFYTCAENDKNDIVDDVVNFFCQFIRERHNGVSTAEWNDIRETRFEDVVHEFKMAAKEWEQCMTP